MTVVSSDQLALLRSDNQWSRVWLGIYKPNTIYTALLNGAPSSTDTVGQISFDGGTGTLSDVKANMTLWVGSTAGARDLGTCRIRKAPISGTFYISHTSEIDWVDNCHLTVVDHFALAQKPVLVSSGNVLMDGETAYTNQHATFDPVPVMGTHAVLWLTGATVSVGFNAGSSWVFGSTISSYAWTAPGASATSGLTTATPTITYNAAGYYAVYCTVTAANGKTATGVRHVMVFDAENMPHVPEIGTVNADYETGGWSFSAKLYMDAEPDLVTDGALCILFAKDYFDGEEQALGAVATRENIICVGWLAGESIQWDADASVVEFTVQGAQDWMKQIPLNPLEVAFATNTPASWSVIAGLTVDRALWHILHWRSNVTALMDVTLTGDTRRAPNLMTMDGSLWMQLSELASKIFARLGVDRFGRFFVEIEPQCVPEASRTWDTLMTLTEKDWEQRVGVKRTERRGLAMLSTSGLRTNTSGAATTLYSLAMGHIQAQHGAVETLDQLLVSTQAQANEQAGLYMGWRNNEWPEFEFNLAQNNRMVDLFPRQFLDVSLAAGDTPRGIAYAGNLIPRAITLQYDSDGLFWRTALVCEAETFAELAVDGDIPASTGFDGGDFSIPPLPDFPPMPDLGGVVYLPPSEGNENHPKKVVIASDTHGVLYTTNFDADEADVLWQAMNDGLTDYLEIGNLVATPSGALYAMVKGSFGVGWEKIMRAAGLGAAWVEVWNVSSHSVANAVINGIGVNKTASDEIAFHVSNSYVSFGTQNLGKLYIGSGASFTQSSGWTNHKNQGNPVGISFMGGMWFVAGNRPDGIGGTQNEEIIWRFTPAGALSISVDSGAGNVGANNLVNAGDQLLYWGQSATGYKLIPYAITGLTHITTQIKPVQDTTYRPQAAAASPTGLKAMGASGAATFPAYKSTDSLATWQAVSGVIPNGSTVWENCGDDSRWIFGGGTTIRVTVDQGASYEGKTGNLGYIAALININRIRFIE